MRSLVVSVNIGDRVCFRANPVVIGVIQGFVLHDYSFYVVWDNGKDDWYRGSDLIALKQVTS